MRIAEHAVSVQQGLRAPMFLHRRLSGFAHGPWESTSRSPSTNAQLSGELQEFTMEEVSYPGQNFKELQQVAKAVNAIISPAKRPQN